MKIALQNLCKNSFPLPSHVQKKSCQRRKWLKQSCRQFYVLCRNVFYFDKIWKMWVWHPKMSCLVLAGVIFWPKWSFYNLALLRIFLHRKTNFSTISFYLNLQINNIFLMTTLLYISSTYSKGMAMGGENRGGGNWGFFLRVKIRITFWDLQAERMIVGKNPFRGGPSINSDSVHSRFILTR